MQRVGVVGLGNIARRHRKNLKKLFPNAKLFALSSSGREPSETISDCDQYLYQVNELITNDVELVIVASPAPYHAQHALPLIKAGIPVLIEKPVTTNLSDIDELIGTADYYGTPVVVGYCLRYLPSAKKMHKLLHENKVGELINASIEIGQYLPDWRPGIDFRKSVSANSQLGGGALFELSHEFDYGRWLLGELNVKTAILRSTEILQLGVEDSVDLLATTKNKAVVSIHLDFLQRAAYRRCRFVGSLGALEWDLLENSIKYSDGCGSQVLYCEPEWDKNNMYLEMIRDFVRLIKGEAGSSVSLKDARNTVSLIHEIKKNAVVGNNF